MAESAAGVQKRVEEQRKAEGARAIYRFTIPKRLVNGVTEIGLIELNSDEELRATKRSHNETHRMVYELAKMALVEVNGEKVKEADGSADAIWKSMDPKVRTLVIAAYGELHTPEQDEINDFLKSQQVTVG